MVITTLAIFFVKRQQLLLDAISAPLFLFLDNPVSFNVVIYELTIGLFLLLFIVLVKLLFHIDLFRQIAAPCVVHDD